jgi:hypothetical protein
MTVTTTASAAAEAVSGHEYPGLAALKAEAYWWHLAALREAPTRERAAARVQSLASAADQIAAALTGLPEAAPDTHRDPVAWTDIATYLTCLARALQYSQMNFGDRVGLSSELDQDGWDVLASATTRREFAAAWYPIREDLVELAALPADDGDRSPRLRSFTAAQVIRAAATLIDAPW